MDGPLTSPACDDPPFNRALAVRLLEHAQAVYQDPHEYAMWALRNGSVGSDIIPRRSTQVGIAYSPTEIIISGRGSSQWGDWGENLLAFLFRWRKLFPVGRLHLGFCFQARRIAKEFRALMEILRAQYPDAKVYVNGHSLGGALCPFLVRLLDLMNIPIQAIYTFESPRVGDRRFSAWYAGLYGHKTFRIVAIRRGVADIVTRIPLSIFGWQHIGRPIMVIDGCVYESEAAWEQARAIHPVPALPWYRLLSRAAVSIGAHSCEALLTELRRDNS